MTLESSPFLKNVLKEDKVMLDTIKKEITSPVEEKSCWDCNGTMKLIRISETIPYNIDDEEKSIVVKNVPMYKCDSCQEILGDVKTFANLERAINREIFLRLNKREEIPNEIDFLDLM